MSPPPDPSRPLPATTPWLGDGEVLVHIGVHKTGTTAVQSALAKARPDLRRHGVLYPGTGTEHFVAANAFLGKRRGGGWSRPMAPTRIGVWRTLMKEVHEASDERVVLSSESLCEATPEQIRAFVDEFRGRPMRVIATFRPLEVLLPSNWQQHVKTGNTTRFDEWLQATVSDPVEPKSPTPSFWMRNDHPSVLQRWADVLGADRVAAVVIDPQVRSMLFETFEDVVGLTRGTLVADAEAPSNRGLSAEEVEFLRQFNLAIDRNLDFRHYHLLVRRAGLLQMVETRSPGPDEHRITVPGWAVEKARSIGRDHIERIGSMGVTVFGDLEHLVPTTPIVDEPVVTPTTVPIDAAVTLLRGTLERSVATIEKLEGVGSSSGSGKSGASAPAARVRGVRAFVPPVLMPWARRASRRLDTLSRRIGR